MNLTKLHANWLLISLFVVSGLFGFQTVEGRVVYDQPVTGEEYSVGFKLSWSTAMEENTQSFVVERSLNNGDSYEEVGFVEAGGTSNGGKDYFYHDLELGLAKAYYRLREVEADGTSSLSEFISLKKSRVHYYMVTSTEAIEKNLFEITVKSIKEGAVEYRLNDALGEIVQQESYPIEAGLNTVMVNLEFEAPGYYSMSLKMDNDLEVLFLNKEEDQENKKKVASKKKSGGG